MFRSSHIRLHMNIHTLSSHILLHMNIHTYTCSDLVIYIFTYEYSHIHIYLSIFTNVGQLDDRVYEHMEMETRMRVEEELERRDNLAREGRLDQVFNEDMEIERDDAHRNRMMHSVRVLNEENQDEENHEEEEVINLEHFDVPLREWIATDRPRREIKRRFRAFLNEFSIEDDHESSSSSSESKTNNPHHNNVSTTSSLMQGSSR